MAREVDLGSIVGPQDHRASRGRWVPRENRDRKEIRGIREPPRRTAYPTGTPM